MCWSSPKKKEGLRLFYTYPKMMKPSSCTVPKEDPRNILKLTFFNRKSAAFVILKNIDIDYILTHSF